MSMQRSISSSLEFSPGRQAKRLVQSVDFVRAAGVVPHGSVAGAIGTLAQPASQPASPSDDGCRLSGAQHRRSRQAAWKAMPFAKTPSLQAAVTTPAIAPASATAAVFASQEDDWEIF